MKNYKIVAATITLARSAKEEKRIKESLQLLSDKNLEAIIIVDGGSSKNFISEISNIKNVTLEVHPHLSLQESIRRSFSIAQKHRPSAIFYAESDKKDFIKEIADDFLKKSAAIIRSDSNFGMIIPSRTKDSFLKFPVFQQYTEGVINYLIRNLLVNENTEDDYCYGPRIISNDLATYLNKADEGIGWGWLSFLLIISKRIGKKIYVISLSLPSPKDEFRKKEKIKLQRIVQLSDHIKGVEAAFKLHL